MVAEVGTLRLGSGGGLAVGWIVGSVSWLVGLYSLAKLEVGVKVEAKVGRLKPESSIVNSIAGSWALKRYIRYAHVSQRRSDSGYVHNMTARIAGIVRLRRRNGYYKPHAGK